MGVPTAPTLRTRLQLLVWGIALPLIAFAGMALWVAHQGERQRVGALLLGQTRAMAQQIDARFSKVESTLTLFAVWPDLDAQGDAWRTLAREVDTDLQLGSIAWVEVATAARQPAAAAAVRAAAASPGTVTWSDFEPAAAAGTGSVHFFVAPLQATATDARVLQLSLPNSVLTQVLREQRLAGGRVAAVLDRQHVVAARSQRAEQVVGQKATAPVQEGLSAQPEGLMFDVVNQDGVRSVVSYARAARSGFAVVTAVPEEEFSAPWRRVTATLLVFGAVLSLLAMGVGWRYGRRVITALDTVRQAESGVAVPTGLRETDEVAARLAVAAQERARAAEARNRALAMVAHELRSPLAVIANWAHLLQKSPGDAGRVNHVASMTLSNVQSLARIVEDLLDLTNIAAGRLRIERRAVRLAEVVTLVVRALTPEAEQRRVSIRWTEPSEDLIVEGDADRLAQVVRNLLGNAVKFSRDDGTISLRLSRMQDRCVLEIEDDGVGIAAEFLPHVFEPFAQGEPARSRGGLGLGLAISRHIVERHGGVIDVDSAGPDRGTTFRVQWPLVSSAPH